MPLTLSDGSGMSTAELVDLYDEVSGWITNGQVAFSTRFNTVTYVFSAAEVTTLTNLQTSLKTLITNAVNVSNI